jgi:hypothetical protein
LRDHLATAGAGVFDERLDRRVAGVFEHDDDPLRRRLVEHQPVIGERRLAVISILQHENIAGAEMHRDRAVVHQRMTAAEILRQQGGEVSVNRFLALGPGKQRIRIGKKELAGQHDPVREDELQRRPFDERNAGGFR